MTTTIIPDAGSTFSPLQPATTRISPVDWGLANLYGRPPSYGFSEVCDGWRVHLLPGAEEQAQLIEVIVGGGA